MTLDSEGLLITNFVPVKNRKCFGYVIKAYNKPGVLHDISKVFSEKNINLLSINFGDRAWREVGTIFIVADFKYSKYRPESVALELEGINGIVEVSIVKPQRREVLANTYHFPIVDVEGSRYVLLDEAALKTLVLKLKEKFGIGGSVLLYHQGLLVGEALKYKFERWGVRDLKEAIDLLILNSIASGRYRGLLVRYPERGDLSKGPIVLRLYNNWECEIGKKNRLNEASSHFERGVIAGLIQAYTSRVVKAVEEKCIALGNRYCEIKVKL